MICEMGMARMSNSPGMDVVFFDMVFMVGCVYGSCPFAGQFRQRFLVFFLHKCRCSGVDHIYDYLVCGDQFLS